MSIMAEDMEEETINHRTVSGEWINPSTIIASAQLHGQKKEDLRLCD